MTYEAEIFFSAVVTNVLEKKIYQLIGGDKTVESSGMEENYKRPNKERIQLFIWL